MPSYTKNGFSFVVWYSINFLFSGDIIIRAIGDEYFLKSLEVAYNKKQSTILPSLISRTG